MVDFEQFKKEFQKKKQQPLSFMNAIFRYFVVTPHSFIRQINCIRNIIQFIYLALKIKKINIPDSI